MLSQDLKFPHIHITMKFSYFHQDLSLAIFIKIYNDDLNSEKEHIRASVCRKL